MIIKIRVPSVSKSLALYHVFSLATSAVVKKEKVNI